MPQLGASTRLWCTRVHVYHQYAHDSVFRSMTHTRVVMRMTCAWLGRVPSMGHVRALSGYRPCPGPVQLIYEMTAHNWCRAALSRT